MKKLHFILIAMLAICFLSSCAVENRIIAKKTWKGQPANFTIKGSATADHPDAKAFVDMLVKDIDVWLKIYKKKADSPDIQMTVSVDKLDPGNRWLRWIAMGFTGQGYCKGTITVTQGGSQVGSYEFTGLQRGGTLFGGTLKDMSNECARGIASKVTNEKFDDGLTEWNK